jgi:hypothetical protein
MLLRVKNCSISCHNDIVRISGTCKVNNTQHIITMTSVEYDHWLDGWPLTRACPHLTRKEIEFLNTGIWS